MHKLKRVGYNVVVRLFGTPEAHRAQALQMAKQEVAAGLTDYITHNCSVVETDYGDTHVRGEFYLVTPNDLEAYVQRRIQSN